MDALRGMAATYGVFYDQSYDAAFLEMVNTAYSQQAGIAYTWPFLEGHLNDMLYRIYDSARDPTLPAILPGSPGVQISSLL
jgi:hypothetical protein